MFHLPGSDSYGKRSSARKQRTLSNRKSKAVSQVLLGRDLARTDRDDSLSVGTIGFGASVGFRSWSYRAGSSRCGNASEFLLTHKSIELIHVRLRIGKADSVPRQHEVAQNVISIPFWGIGILKQNRDYG